MSFEIVNGFKKLSSFLDCSTLVESILVLAVIVIFDFAIFIFCNMQMAHHRSPEFVYFIYRDSPFLECLDYLLDARSGNMALGSLILVPCSDYNDDVLAEEFQCRLP